MTNQDTNCTAFILDSILTPWGWVSLYAGLQMLNGPGMDLHALSTT
jgi:hypothetical protein